MYGCIRLMLWYNVMAQAARQRIDDSRRDVQQSQEVVRDTQCRCNTMALSLTMMSTMRND